MGNRVTAVTIEGVADGVIHPYSKSSQRHNKTEHVKGCCQRHRNRGMTQRTSGSKEVLVVNISHR